MTGHLSVVQVDEAAADLAAGNERAHLDACDQCRERVDKVAREASALRGSAAFTRVRAQLPAQRVRPWIRWSAPAGLAAAVAWAMLAPRQSGVRAKGFPTLTLVRPDGAPVKAPRSGDIVELRLTGGSRHFALVTAVEGAAPPSVLWPIHGTRSGPLAPGARAVLHLAVTPGSTRVIAIFSDQPLEAAAALAPPLDTEIRTLDVATAP